MDHLEIDSAHVVGASMGGMIVQQMAIDRPERVRSLVSIMSTTGSRWTGLPTVKAFGVLLLQAPATTATPSSSAAVRTFKVIGSPGYPFDEERVREIAGRSYDRGVSAAGVARQLHAITASGDRTRGLEGVEPAGDRDPRQPRPAGPPSGGRATAAAIPGARLKMIDGMGHDLPRELWPVFAEEIARRPPRPHRRRRDRLVFTAARFSTTKGDFGMRLGGGGLSIRCSRRCSSRRCLPPRQRAATVVNGGFETGTLSGWNVQRATEAGDWFAYRGTEPPPAAAPGSDPQSRRRPRAASRRSPTSATRTR